MHAEEQDGDLRLGEHVDRYVVEELLGKGGMGTVYRVRHKHLNSLHALKLLHVVDPQMRRRMIDEGRSQARLRHPNVVSVTDALVHRDRPCLVMEYVDGPSLYQLLHTCRLSLDEALEIFRGVLRGVDAAHRHGIVHRDLKPDNVLLQPTEDDGVIPKVSDFGLAKVLVPAKGSKPITRAGAFLGTPEYMAPEQMRDASDVDHRADLFSLGCILYELVTGELAFEGTGIHGTIDRVMRLDYEPPEKYAPDLPPRVRDAIRRLLAPRDQRPADCGEVMKLLYGNADKVRFVEDDEEAATANSVVSLSGDAMRQLYLAPTKPPARPRMVVPVAPAALSNIPTVGGPPDSGGQAEAGVQWMVIVAVAFAAGLLGMVVWSAGVV